MILPSRKDAVHKAVMYRLLIHILDDKVLSENLFFKGGSCASILGWLDRFSIDLDFDLKRGINKKTIHKNIISVVKHSGFSIDKQAKSTLFFILKYDAPGKKRNTLKLSIIDNPPYANEYKQYYLPEIDRYATCQTKETMFANKLVGMVDRYEKYKTIAGRDLYDIHYFFGRGFSYDKQVIEKRRGISIKKYFQLLIRFVEKKVTLKIIEEDLNYLLPPDRFKQIRTTLKTETLIYLNDELRRMR